MLCNGSIQLIGKTFMVDMSGKGTVQPLVSVPV